MLSIEKIIQTAKDCGIKVYAKDDVKPNYFKYVNHASIVGYTIKGRIIVREIRAMKA